MKWWDRMPWSSFSECWALSQLFHSPLSLSSRGFLVPLHFCHKGGVICIFEVIGISLGNLDSSLCFFQSSVSHDVLWVGCYFLVQQIFLTQGSNLCLCFHTHDICCFELFSCNAFNWLLKWGNKKDLHNPDNHDGVITHLEPDILECEVKWALENITTDKASGGDRFQLSYFKSWKMMLWKCCTQYASKFGKLSSGHRTGKGQFSFQFQRRAMPKNAQTTAQLHSSHTLVK